MSTEPTPLVAAFPAARTRGYVTPDPDALAAVAALERCLRLRDYAGATQLVRQRRVLDGLGILTAMGRQSWAERAYWQSVAEWRAEHEAALQRRLERDVAELVALVAEVVLDEAPVSPSLAGHHRDEAAQTTRRDAA